ncbi:MAG: response regulator [Chryseosolibacter sp.]
MIRRNYTVFLVDDDDDDQEIFALALAEVDDSIACVTAKNGMEALDKLGESKFRPDFIFLDLNMPRMNGKQCLREIKNQVALSKIPVVIYSTSSEKRDIEETKALGAAAFITKPPGISELIRSLQNIFIELQ